MGGLLPTKSVIVGAVWAVVLLAALNRVSAVSKLING